MEWGEAKKDNNTKPIAQVVYESMKYDDNKIDIVICSPDEDDSSPDEDRDFLMVKFLEEYNKPIDKLLD